MILVTSNRHKYVEISNLFEKAGIKLEWVQMKYEEIQEDTTEIISYRSCVVLRKELGKDFFLEDTGLYVQSLKGFPGPYSSFVNSTIGYEGLQKLVEGKDNSSYFKTVVSLSIGERIIQFGGILRGRISTEAAGSGGFGFDPVFVPDGQNLTLAEMDVESKNHFSHRARAVSSLLGYLLATQK